MSGADRRRTLISLGVLAVLAAGAAGSRAQTSWPGGRPITLMVPFPAGGATDSLARTLGGRLADALKVPVVVENRPGGAAQIAVAAVRQAPADGCMLFVGDVGAFALNPSLYPRLNYDPLKDLVPIARLAVAPTLLVVPAASPWKTAADLLAAIKERPDAVSVASQGNGTLGHLFAQLLQSRAGARVVHVPYKGSAPALQDLLGGQVQVLLDPVATSGPYVKDGRLRALALAATQRLKQYADVPTFDEVGLPELALAPWFGVAVRSGTPDETLRTLQLQLNAALVSTPFASRMAELSLLPAPLIGSEFAAFVRAETGRWAKVIKDGGITLE